MSDAIPACGVSTPIPATPTRPSFTALPFLAIIKRLWPTTIQTEVSQLLRLMVHSLYSHPEIFHHELISNSSRETIFVCYSEEQIEHEN
jgi:hypothetical protein